MSRIEKLIEELCPGGVEWKTLGEIGEFIRGNGLQKKDFTESGVGCIHYGQIFTHYGTVSFKTKSFVAPSFATKLRKAQKGNLVIATTSENVEDVCKAVVWLGEEEIAISGDAYIYKHNQNPKYIAYFYQTQMFFYQKQKYTTGTKVIRVSGDNMAKIKIPIPPLPIQKEIVNILDKFTALDASLQAELEARKKQYEHYRNQLLDFEGKEVAWKLIDDLTEVITGGEAPVNCIKSSIPNEVYKYPIFANGLEVYGYTDNYKIDKDSVTISSIGANTGTVYYRKAYFTPIIRLKVLIPKVDNLLSKYLYYYLSSIKINSKKGSVPNMNADDVKKLQIPIPPLSEQERIVEILDKFDKLVNEELPAEIAARRKQYEYYREKLLNFEPLTN